MKKKLLLMTMALMASVVTFAQDWTEPEQPTEASDVVSGHQYQIKNVETDQYLCGGSSWYSWATSAVVSSQENALTFTLTQVSNEEDPTQAGWTIARTTDGKYTFMSGASPQGLTNLGEMHVDMAAQGHNFWDIVKQENGYYHIRIIAADAVYGENGTTADFYGADKCWGWDKTYASAYPTAVYGNVTPGDQYACDWAFIDYSLYNARLSLYNLLISEDNTTYNVDITSYGAIYNDASASLETVNQAVTDLKQLVQLKASLLEQLTNAGELSVESTAEQAVFENTTATAEQIQAAIDSLKTKNASAMTDFTDFFINNAHFAEGTPLDNGVCTYAKDKETNATPYSGMQEVKDWTPNDPGTDAKASGLFPVGGSRAIWLGSKPKETDTDGYLSPVAKANGSTEGNVFGFVGCWTATAYYKQEVTLPAGSYTITIPTYNSKGGTTAIAKNLCGFVADDGTEYLATTTVFPVNTWSNETIKFKLEEETSGYISIGYKAANKGSGDMPHLFIDEFTLMYNGKANNPSLIALSGAINNGNNIIEAEEPCEATKMDALEEAVSAGEELKDASSSDTEANVAAATAINNAVAEVKTSIAKYKEFNTFITGTLDKAIKKYDGNEDTQELADSLSDDKENVYLEAYNNGEYTSAEIDSIINGFSTRIINSISTTLNSIVGDGKEHNLDITCLYASENLDFANSTITGWNNETGTSAFLSRVQTAEVWNQTNFNCYKQLADMPAGLYQLTIPGFYRSSDNVTNYNEVQEGNVVGSSYVYIEGVKTLMHNVAEEAYLLHAEAADDNHAGTITDGELYVVNSNANAHYYFYNQEDADCSNTAVGALAERGTLTFGVKGVDLESNEWTVWGAATLIYKGSKAEDMSNAIYQKMKQKKAEAEALADNASLVTEAEDKLNNALTATEECSEESSVEELTKVINALDEAIAYTNEAVTLRDKVSDLNTVYNALLVTVEESSDESLAELIGEVEGKLDEGFESVKELNGYMESLPAAWTKYVQADRLATATLDNPADVSDVILNRGFEGVVDDNGSAIDQTRTWEDGKTGNGDYWTKTREGGNDFGYQTGVYESWNTTSFDIHQTITGLANGYYRLKVQSFMRAANANQDNANFFAGDSCQSAAYLYANTNGAEIINQVENGNQAVSLSDGNEELVTYLENSIYVPTNRTGCAAYFTAGLYWNEVDAEVTDGTLTIGIKKGTHVTGDWTPFDNFQLYYLGTEAPTGVKAVDAAETTSAAAKTIYDLTGRRVAKAQKGIYIINGKKVIK